MLWPAPPPAGSRPPTEAGLERTRELRRIGLRRRILDRLGCLRRLGGSRRPGHHGDPERPKTALGYVPLHPGRVGVSLDRLGAWRVRLRVCAEERIDPLRLGRRSSRGHTEGRHGYGHYGNAYGR